MDAAILHGNLLNRVRKLPQRRGPEQELISEFLTALRLQKPDEVEFTVFEEPRIESGCPDLVIVRWNSSIARDWPLARKALTVPDLRVLHHIYSTRRCDLGELESIYSKSVRRSVDRLLDAEIITQSRGRLRCRAVSKVFAITELIAIEAEIGDVQTCLNQAFLNTWFSAKLYMLLPQSITASRFFAGAESLGIGVIHPGSSLPTRRGRMPILPRSYASWLFNEWAWRHSAMNEHRSTVVESAVS